MKIDPLVFSAKFPDRCRLDLCRSRCCRFGVWVDVEERNTILLHQDLFTRYLRPEAKDPKAWFGKTEADGDCPSGLAVETQEIAGGCAFYHPDHGCALQKGAAEAGLHEWAFKPRFCVMFPLVVTGGELTVDDEMKSLWCMKERNRTRPILDALRKEVEFLFDEETLRKPNGEEVPLQANNHGKPLILHVAECPPQAKIVPGDGAQRGVPMSGGTLLILTSSEKGVSRRTAGISSSGIGSERSQVASVAKRKPPASP